MTASSLAVEQKPCFQFKTHFLPCTVLQILYYNDTLLERQLSTTLSNSPSFFTDLPVIIDLDKMKSQDTLDFVQLKEILLTNKMILVGVRGGNEAQHLSAAQAGLPLLPASKLSMTEVKPTKKEEPIMRLTKLVTTPIRSGMQVYAKDSDLIVTAAVSQGAELLADGNIHVYGPLRGRVLAGVQGNLQARIYCSVLDAELVSIAGYYLTKEDMLKSPLDEGMKQIFLDNEQVRIEVL